MSTPPEPLEFVYIMQPCRPARPAIGTEDAYMNSNLLEVSGLHVSAGEKEILHGVDLTVGKDETHVIMGPNGTGKSTLGLSLIHI